MWWEVGHGTTGTCLRFSGTGAWVDICDTCRCCDHAMVHVSDIFVHGGAVDVRDTCDGRDNDVMNVVDICGEFDNRFMLSYRVWSLPWW